MTFESAVSIISGFITILTALIALVMFIYRTARRLPHHSEVLVTARQAEELSRQKVPDPELIPSCLSGRENIAPVPQSAPENRSTPLPPAEQLGGPPSPEQVRSSRWRAARDYAGDIAPLTTAFLVFSAVIVLAVVGKVTTGTLFSVVDDGREFLGFGVTLLFGSFAGYLGGCVIAVVLYGCTASNLRRAGIAIPCLCIAGLLFGWLAYELPGLIIGLGTGVALGPTPVLPSGLTRFHSRLVARYLIGRAIRRDDDDWANPDPDGGDLDYSMDGWGWGVLREVALMAGMDYSHIATFKDNRYIRDAGRYWNGRKLKRCDARAWNVLYNETCYALQGVIKTKSLFMKFRWLFSSFSRT